MVNDVIVCIVFVLTLLALECVIGGEYSKYKWLYNVGAGIVAVAIVVCIIGAVMMI